MGKRRRKPLNGPPPVAEADFLTGEVGPPLSQMPMPPVKSRGQLIPRPDWQTGESAPQSPKDDRANRPLVPASEDVAQLPRSAREAFAARCAARVEPLRAGVTRPEGAAALVLAAATVETPIRRQLLCIRRDFDRLVYLAKQHNWTDDTPVPPDVFGPMWPEGLTPGWAREEPSAPPT